MSTYSTTDMGGEPLQIPEAYQRVSDADEAARLDVFDVYPEGTPPENELTRRQADRLRDLKLAEIELTNARKGQHATKN